MVLNEYIKGQNDFDIENFDKWSVEKENFTFGENNGDFERKAGDLLHSKPFAVKLVWIEFENDVKK